MLTILRSIVSSRKRKLRELFAVATDENGIPNHDFSNPDAPPTTPAEAKFLIECDILQYALTSLIFSFYFSFGDVIASRQV